MHCRYNQEMQRLSTESYTSNKNDWECYQYACFLIVIENWYEEYIFTVLSTNTLGCILGTTWRYLQNAYASLKGFCDM